jgi:predicted ATPase
VLERLRVRGFKSLRDLEVRLAPIVVVFGPNAVGKSNVLESLQLLARLATERTLSDALSPPLRGYPLEAFSIPKGGLSTLLTADRVELEIEADVCAGDRRLRYGVAIQATPQTGELSVAGEHLVVLTADSTPKHKPRIEESNGHLVVRRRNEAGKHRSEPLGLNHTLASNLQLSGDLYPDFDALRAELGSWRSYYLDPGSAMREPQPPREVVDIGPHGERIAPFLHRLRGSPRYAKYFGAVARALHSAIPTIETLCVELDERRGTLDISITQDGASFSSRVISEGTLRVLALCAIAANPWPSAMVAFEEPENGVHPGRLEVIADLLLSMARPHAEIPARQVIVTTHSPVFVAAMLARARSAPDLVRLVRCVQSGGSTTLEPFEPSGELLEDAEIRAALRPGEDGQLVESMLVRGWLDG